MKIIVAHSNKQSSYMGSEYINRVFGKMEIKWRRHNFFQLVKTEELGKSLNMKIKCEGCILKCEDINVNIGWLDPQLYPLITDWEKLFALKEGSCILEVEVIWLIFS